MSEHTVCDSLPRFYLSAVTPQGYSSLAPLLEDAASGWRTYILKGCPGSGKEVFLDRLAGEMALHFQNLQLFACASGGDGLDGIGIEDIGVYVLAGSWPHPLEPQTPCAYDRIIPMEDCEYPDIPPQNRREVAGLWQSLRENARRRQRFLQAASALTEDTAALALEQTDREKLRRFAARLAARELSGIKASRRGKENCRYLSCLTGGGISVLEETVPLLCGRVWFLRDDWGAPAALLLEQLRQSFLEGGCDVISCRCPLRGKLEHLLVPQLDLALMTQNRFHPLRLTQDRTVHVRRFVDVEQLRRSRARMSWNYKGAREMLAHAAELLAADEEIYRRLEVFGRESCNCGLLDRRLYGLIRSLLELGPPDKV